MKGFGRFRPALVGAIVGLFITISPASAVPIALELLLAIDVSGSISSNEFNLQKQGYANAFQSQNVVDAITGSETGSIAVSLMYWGNYTRQSQAVDWTLIDSAASSMAFANLIAGTTRPFSGSTSLSGAIRFGANLFNGNGFEGTRKAMDISGDGPNNSNRPGVTLPSARTNALNAGITINALPIGGDSLVEYFEENVIGGPDAFVIQATDFASFNEAIESKIVREIAGEIPEPGTWFLLGTGLAGFALAARRRKAA